MDERLVSVLILRCFAEPGELEGKDGYYAHCIDLDLAVWRPTYEEAREALDEALEGYIEVAIEEASSFDEFCMLMKQRSPLFPYRVRYHQIALQRAFSFHSQYSDRPIPSLFEEQVAIPKCFA